MCVKILDGVRQHGGEGPHYGLGRPVDDQPREGAQEHGPAEGEDSNRSTHVPLVGDRSQNNRGTRASPWGGNSTQEKEGIGTEHFGARQPPKNAKEAAT